MARSARREGCCRFLRALGVFCASDGCLRLLPAALLLLAACRALNSPESANAPAATLTPALTPTPQVSVGLAAAPTAAGPVPTAVLLNALLVGQHISASGSYSQTETEAAGPMTCQIQRDSCAFGLLVRGDVPGLIFVRADPPYDDEVTLMHADMLRPLARLSQMVEAEWGGEIKLLVTAAYDSQGWHDLAQMNLRSKYSLHFEGRSIDVVPFPPEPENIARVCALAHQAGFDWVHNEQDHCHASLRADSLCNVCSWIGAP